MTYFAYHRIVDKILVVNKMVRSNTVLLNVAMKSQVESDLLISPFCLVIEFYSEFVFQR